MRLGIMCSGNGTNFENIVRTCSKHEVVLMIHNKKECGAAEKADKLGISHCRISSKDEQQMADNHIEEFLDLIKSERERSEEFEKKSKDIYFEELLRMRPPEMG